MKKQTGTIAKNGNKLDRYRPVPFYFLTATAPEDYTEQAVFSAMTECKDAGFGGIVLFNKPPLGFDAEGYLSDAWFEHNLSVVFQAQSKKPESG